MNNMFFLIAIDGASGDLAYHDEADIFETVSAAADHLVDVALSMSEMSLSSNYTIVHCEKIGNDFLDVVSGREVMYKPLSQNTDNVDKENAEFAGTAQWNN